MKVYGRCKATLTIHMLRSHANRTSQSPRGMARVGKAKEPKRYHPKREQTMYYL
jgi:hypothetical protein